MKTILPLFLILLCLLPISQTASVSDSMILDLDATDFTEFSSQAASWTLSEAVCPTCDHTYTIPTTSCWPTTTWKVIGGPNVLGPSGSSAKNQYIQKEYPPMEKFPTYAVLQYDLTLFADVALGSSTITSSYVDFQINGVKSGSGSNSIGQCNPNMVDSQGITILTMNRYSVGRSNFDLSSISESQNGKGITIKFLNMLNYPTTQRSWGVRNIKLYMFRNASQYSATNFPCGYGFFWDNELGCTTCHPFCKTCTGTTNNQCTSCNYPNFKYPNTTCLDTCVVPFTATLTSTLNTCKLICTTTAKPYYVGHTATCSATCDSPLVSNSDKLCSLPCGTDGYLYSDGSCSSDCDAPFEQGTTFSGLIKTCTSTCANYLYSDGSCQTDCPAPLLTKETGGVKTCYNPCEWTGDFLYPDSSCVDKCESPLLSESGVDGQYCKSTCPSHYIYPDGSCVADCESPLVAEKTGGIHYCKNTCNGFLYPGGSCVDDCESPLEVETKAGVKYCKSPCSDVDDYVYLDGSCAETCPAPLSEKTETQIKYCYNPCKESDTYLNSNQLCQANCPSPSTIKTEAIGKFCVFPCENLNDYYYEKTGKCQATCKSPNTAVDSPLPKICNAPPESTPTPGGEDPEPTPPSKGEEDEDDSIEKISKTKNKANTVLSAGTFASSLLSPFDSTLSFIGPFSKMLQYIRYMKIDYPEKVQIMLKQQSDSFQDFPNKMAPNMLKEFPQHELPEKFELYSTPSSFFVNFWSAFFKIAVILFVTFVVILIAVQRKKDTKQVNGTLKIIVEALKWNLVLNFFCSNIGDVVLFTALEMKTLHFSNAAATISFLLCLAANVAAIYVVFKILNITWALEKLKTKVAPLEEKKKESGEKWSSCKTLYAPYQDRWYYQQIFLFIFIARFCLFNLMLGYLFEYPLLQASIFVILDILMLAFLVIKKPMKSFVSLIMGVIFELLLLPFNICVLILAIMDRKGIEDYDQRKRIGDVMIYINLIAPFIAITLLATKVFLIGKDLYKQIKAQKKNQARKFSVIHPESVLNATHPNNNTTRILLPSGSLADKNLLINSQKLDLEDSPMPSPGRSLVSNNRISRLSTLVEKTKKGGSRQRSTIIFPDSESTSPGLSPLKDPGSQSSSSKSITPPEGERSNVENVSYNNNLQGGRSIARIQQRRNLLNLAL